MTWNLEIKGFHIKRVNGDTRLFREPWSVYNGSGRLDGKRLTQSKPAQWITELKRYWDKQKWWLVCKHGHRLSLTHVGAYWFCLAVPESAYITLSVITGEPKREKMFECAALWTTEPHGWHERHLDFSSSEEFRRLFSKRLHPTFKNRVDHFKSVAAEDSR